MIQGVSKVVVPVADQERAKRFWTQQLGFTVAVDEPYGEERWIEVVPPDKGGQPKDFELGMLNNPQTKDGKGHGQKFLGVAGSLAHLPNAAPDLGVIAAGGAASIPGAQLGSVRALAGF